VDFFRINLKKKFKSIFQDRLKAIGAEEFIHMRSSDSISDSDSIKSLNPWTYCLESYINWSNRLSSFVTTEIIKHLKRHIRVKLLNYFIDAALECFNTGNFNSMMGILGKIIDLYDKKKIFFFMFDLSAILICYFDFNLGGLNMLPVKRLKKTVNLSIARKNIFL